MSAAVAADDAVAVEAVLAAGFDPDASLTGISGTRAIHVAILNRSLNAIAVLGSYGADLDVPLSGQVDTPVAWAANGGMADLVVALLSAGADPSLLPTDTSWGPTHYAGYDGDVDMLEVLVGAGVDMEIPDPHGYTALHFACATGSMAAVQFLIESGADADAVADNGFTPADSAADRNQTEVLAYLASLGYEPS